MENGDITEAAQLANFEEFGDEAWPVPASETQEGSPQISPVEHIRQRRAGPQTSLAICLNRLNRIGLPHHVIDAALLRSRQTGAPLVHELAMSGHLDLGVYFRLLASDLGVEYAQSVENLRIMGDLTPTHFRHGRTVQMCCRHADGLLVLYMSPDLTGEQRLSRMFEKRPELREHFRIMEPSLILRAIGEKLRSQDVNTAVNKLHDKHRYLSAKETLTATQAFALGCSCVALPVLLIFAFWETLLAIHVLATFAFAVVTTIRLAAFVHLWKRGATRDYQDEREGVFPTYSVLVALHKEAAVASQIVRSMSKLDWPGSRLEVFYICEEGDAQTLDALARIRMPPSHKIIEVPAAAPMTKPKALNFALERCNGDFVVIYDAEDRPHPQQLRQAWSIFRHAGEDLACLQAPLLVTNLQQGWLARMFAFEYASHFYGLLPYLACIGSPLPLGGTSNHFRRNALEKVSAWDPYNVTEDADLGIRLYRFGYRCSVIDLPTLEDAPTSLKQWIPQRTRWIKGWIQTLLVHNRKNRSLLNVIGTYNFFLFQILMLGFVFSPLLYGISLIEFSILLSFDLEYNFHQNLILIIDCFVFGLGHLAHIMISTLAWRRAHDQSATIAMCISLPAYWVLGTYAAWRAVWKLIRAPFEWEKTEHNPVIRERQFELEP